MGLRPDRPALTGAPGSVPRAILTQAAGAGFNAAVSLGLVLLLARVLGPASFGEYVALVGFAAWALVLIDGGWAGLLYRETVPTERTQPPAGDRLYARATAHVLLAGAALALVAAMLLLPLGAAIGCMIVVALSNLVSSRMRARGSFQREAGFQAAGRLASAVAILAAAQLFPRELWPLFLAWAVGLTLVLIAFRAWLARPSWGSGGTALALPFLLIEGAAMLLYKSDVALLRVWGTSGAALSEFAAGTRFNEAALLLGAPAANVLMREFRLRQGDARGLRAYVRRWIALAVGVGALLWSLCVMAAEPLVRVVFGPGFGGAADLLPWTSSSLIVALPNLLLAQALVAANRERQLVAIYAAGAVGVIIAIAAGNQVAGLRGAAAGLALVHAGVFAAACWAALREPTRAR